MGRILQCGHRSAIEPNKSRQSDFCLMNLPENDSPSTLMIASRRVKSAYADGDLSPDDIAFGAPTHGSLATTARPR